MKKQISQQDGGETDNIPNLPQGLSGTGVQLVWFHPKLSLESRQKLQRLTDFYLGLVEKAFFWVT